MKSELVNKINKLFPEFTNIFRSNQAFKADPDVHTDANGNYMPSDKVDNGGTAQTLDLFTKLSEKWFDKKVLENGVIGQDIIKNVEEINIGAGAPMINIEVIKTSDAKMDGQNFDSGHLETSICQVRLHRFHTDFKLFDTDIMYGYGVENKAKSAMNSVLRKIQNYYIETVLGKYALGATSPHPLPLTAKGVATYAGIYPTPDTLYVRNSSYAKLIANTLGKVDITQPGALGWGRIVRVNGSDEAFASYSADAIGLNEGNVVGVAGAQAFDAIAAFAGGSVAVRDMGSVWGIPFTAIFSFDPTTFAIRCTVQAWVGFEMVNQNTRYVLKADGDTDVEKVEVVNTTAKPVNTKAVTA